MQEESQDPLIEEALRWLVLLRDEQATDADRQRFAEWLGRDPAHAVAWSRAQHVWSHAEIMRPAIRASRAAPLAARMSRTQLGPSRRAWMRGAAAAVVGAAGGYLLTRPEWFADYRTAVAERRAVTLPDGSVAELGSTTALSIESDRSVRRAVLHDGEAFFTVAQDLARPFVVEATGGRIQALGTAFNVKQSGEAVTVAVAEHAVAVSAGEGRAVTVDQGRQVRYGPGRLGPVRPANLPTVLAWRRDRLIFQDAPLGDVIAELERYRSGRIVITDRRIAEISVTAVFDTRRTDDALRAIADSLPVQILRVTDFLLFVSPAG
ncbi:FecR domain-containing protein [Rhodospirillaceae bacterium SYSU D60014]|uniref:FecR family protein n=1 Tax=Virgifigura deserti TaxID=2268457 RepID=UPI000E66A90B